MEGRLASLLHCGKMMRGTEPVIASKQSGVNANRRTSTTGLSQFLNLEQQRDWLEDKAVPPDADERPESLELRFRYLARFEKLLRRPQAQEVIELLRRYGRDCLPI